ncbi:MAG: 2-amino-4-hydroxy-6-hydroxymethyldihydropteridine diphosphokinase [Bacteroidaceae bacterium]|nr:2-amino-4-hydroxy-6-hydroxymethyldihydropteridine diphosphokinase [Bacteroidaceae bacterium]
MHKLYISLGSNLGNKEEKLHRAIELINERIGSVLRTSSFIETEPWGFQSENTFLNAACLVETNLTPRQCLRETQKIERLLGRTLKSKDGVYHDRPIDLDLLLYDDLQINEDDLILPHPHMKERDFVMIPLREIMEH